MKHLNIAIMVLTTLLVQSCSVMPYQEESSCKFNNLGKCLPIDKAYEEAITGIDQGGKKVNGEVEDATDNLFWSANNDKIADISKLRSSKADKESYQSAIYQKMQKLVDQKEMPILAPAVVQRVLILPYRSNDSKVWNEARHIYYIEELPRWTLDGYAPNQQPSNSLNLFK
ncbi:hypothetical protein BHECKSOX_2008 [Bathymodiolus heckerae thiotrophic gill symbiont]|uniref:TraV family lipoprotein n=1 Tax=Bathymodiolus heckerae thiotrophic gill symbiont TaxID=1052212 RepID=UPI0010AFE7DB|nr:TraV family lipoprotein [Bathymodiolus heckerae thiotrophic gill symbiont]SHN89537.1 hypothetical protein BHECKSOX_2008 [Bathymodiolus heckerae thiotrophic gill symbiont]